MACVRGRECAADGGRFRAPSRPRAARAPAPPSPPRTSRARGPVVVLFAIGPRPAVNVKPRQQERVVSPRPYVTPSRRPRLVADAPSFPPPPTPPRRAQVVFQLFGMLPHCRLAVRLHATVPDALQVSFEQDSDLASARPSPSPAARSPPLPLTDPLRGQAATRMGRASLEARRRRSAARGACVARLA